MRHFSLVGDKLPNLRGRRLVCTGHGFNSFCLSPEQLNAQPTEQLLLNLVEPEAPTLDNFRVGPNAELLAALRECKRGVGPQFIYIWGPHGSGRSHLLRALTPTQRMRVPDFDEHVLLYTIDNVEKLDAEDLERLFFLMNEVRSHPLSRIVCAGAVRPNDLVLREDVKTRLMWGLAYQLRYLSADEAGDEFLRLARERGIEFDETQQRWIEARCPRDMPGLRHFLDAVDHWAVREHRRITTALLDAALKEVVRNTRCTL